MWPQCPVPAYPVLVAALGPPRSVIATALGPELVLTYANLTLEHYNTSTKYEVNS